MGNVLSVVSLTLFMEIPRIELSMLTTTIVRVRSVHSSAVPVTWDWVLSMMIRNYSKRELNMSSPTVKPLPPAIYKPLLPPAVYKPKLKPST